MSALFNFQSLLLVILLLICTCTYVRALFPSIVDRNKTGSPPPSINIPYTINPARSFLGVFFMSARVGERLSPYVSLACLAMAMTILIQ